MFMDGTVKTPLPEAICRLNFRSFGRFLSLEEFLEINPLSLSLG